MPAAPSFSDRRPGLSLILWAGIGLLVLILTYRQLPANLPATGGFIPYCSDAHARGLYNIPRGDPRYRPALDADGDGFACEPLPR